MPRQFASAATGWPTRGASSCWPPSRSACSWSSAATPTPSSRSTRSACSSCFTLSQTGMVRHWFPAREPGWRWRAGINAFGAILTAVVLVVVGVGEVPRRRLAGGRPHPGPRRDDAVHPAPVRALEARARGRADLVVRGTPSRGAGRGPDPGPDPGGRPGDQRRALDQRRHPGGLHLGRPRGGRRAPRALGAPGPGRPAGRRRIARTGPSSGRCWPTSTCSTRPGRRTRTAPITFVVLPEYVARSWWERILYNQSVQAAADGPAGSAAHGRRQRARTGARTRRPSSPPPVADRTAASRDHAVGRERPAAEVRPGPPAVGPRRWYRDRHV